MLSCMPSPWRGTRTRTSVLVRNRVLHLNTAARDTAGVAASRDPLVGREEEVALLRRLLGDARTGSGHLVLVSGPAGIGKTRLVEELLAAAEGGPVGWGAAVADATMPALWPWI